jgi:ribosome-binding protein aMBF1 (putative translation factor)
MKIGRIIENARREKGWSREVLSEKTSHYVSESTIKRLESRQIYKISADKLIALCAALEFDISSLYQKPR